MGVMDLVIEIYKNSFRIVAKLLFGMIVVAFLWLVIVRVLIQNEDFKSNKIITNLKEIFGMIFVLLLFVIWVFMLLGDFVWVW